MEYIITFLEGLISFISPCMLPLLPVYISFFAGSKENGSQKKTLRNVLAFVLGFTVVFTSLGVFAGTVGAFLKGQQAAVNIVCGAVVIVLGLSYLEVIRLPFFKGVQGEKAISGALSAFVFGIIYSINLTPCIGAFLGSALMLASSEGGAVKGMLLLVTYSMGLGVPFVISAILIDRLKSTFSFIKRHYKVINTVSGLFLILMGALIMTGVLGKFLRIFS